MTRQVKSGVYNGLCDVCGFKKSSTELRKRWDGMIVCKDDWETRHVNDFYRNRIDTHLLPWTRPDNNGIDVSPPVYMGLFCNIINSQPFADQAVADCGRLTQ